MADCGKSFVWLDSLNIKDGFFFLVLVNGGIWSHIEQNMEVIETLTVGH